MATARSPRRTVIGTVVSDRMPKTISVREQRKVKHVKYGKYVVRNTTYKAHDEERKAKAGDIVEIAWARRLSKTKFWRLVRVVEAARVVAVTGAVPTTATRAPSEASRRAMAAPIPPARPAPVTIATCPSNRRIRTAPFPEERASDIRPSS